MKQGIKKAVVGILAVSMVASVGAVSAFAAGTGRNFADADGNGVCDNYSVEQTVSRAAGALQKGSGQNFVDADNDGICDNYAVGQATGQETGQETASSQNRGQNYVDEDNDTVCDNYDPSRTTGRGMGVARNGLGWNFVDAAGAGVCDHLGTGQGRQYRGEMCIRDRA